MVRDGYFYGFGLIAVAVVVWVFTGAWGWSVPPLLLAAFFLWFFRDPKRAIPQEPGLVVSPADGKVTEVARVSAPGGGLIRISIFLSVFDVHVNRSPVAGVLKEIRYRKGEYLNAMNPASAERNEQNLARLECADGTQVSFIQIAGLLARRIVFNRRVGDVLERGERVGLIKFGSRTDVLLPDYAEPLVKPGDRVRGGSSVIARLPEAELEPLMAVADAEMSI
ncbi:MAG: phosphatidylserine decarboxylase family protein [Acidobacteriaceae bacterium]